MTLFNLSPPTALMRKQMSARMAQRKRRAALTPDERAAEQAAYREHYASKKAHYQARRRAFYAGDLVFQREDALERYRRGTLPTIMVNQAKRRSTERGWAFDLSVADIVIPTHCPICDQALVRGDHKQSPSLDRLDSSRGYTRDNIAVICRNCNRRKQDGDIKFFKRVLEYLSARGLSS